MEAIIVALAAIVVVLLHRIRNVNEQLDQARTSVATGKKKVDELESQLMAATESFRLESRRSSELEEELTAVREALVEVNSQRDSLAGQLQEEIRVSKSETQQNAELISQLKAARREIRELRKVIATQDEESRLARASHSDLAMEIVKLTKQLDDSHYALSKETSLRTTVSTERRQYRRRVESESQERSEVEEQLRSALLEVQRLAKELRKLKADQAKQGRARNEDAQRIVDLESELAMTRLKLEHESALRVKVESQLQVANEYAEDQAKQKAAIDEKLKEYQAARQSSHDSAKLESELKRFRDRHKNVTSKLKELESQLAQAKGEADDRRRRCNELEALLNNASEMANRTFYEHLIQIAIAKLLDSEGLFKKTMDIESRQRHGYEPGSQITIRAAKQEASCVEQVIYDAVKSKTDRKNVSADESDIEDQVMAEIDSGISQTGLKVADVISIARQIHLWEY